MAIDWGATGEMIANFAGWAEAGAIAYAAHKAADTFTDWRLRRSTERQEEIAQRTLVAVFKTKEALRKIRLPGVSSSMQRQTETALMDDPNWDSLGPDEQKRQVRRAIYYQRAQSAAAEFDELADCIPIARAILGEEVANAIESLHRQRDIVLINADSLPLNNGEDRDWSARIDENLTDHMLTGDGEVTASIKESIAIIQAHCLPILRAETKRGSSAAKPD